MASWRCPDEHMPPAGLPVESRLRHCVTHEVETHKLVAVYESDCTWRTADDRCEISNAWDVVGWLDETPVDPELATTDGGVSQ